MVNRLLYLLGGLAPILFLLSVIIGGMRRTGYSHVVDPVSALGMTGARDCVMVNAAWALTGVLIMVLGLAVWRDDSGLGKPAAASLMFAGAGSAAIALWFPMDPPGVLMTTAQLGHNILVAVSALVFATALVLGALSRAAPLAYRLLTWAGLAAMFAGGAGAALSNAYGWDLVGAFERITQAGYHLWLLLTAAVGFFGLWRRLRRGPP